MKVGALGGLLGISQTRSGTEQSSPASTDSGPLPPSPRQNRPQDIDLAGAEPASPLSEIEPQSEDERRGPNNVMLNVPNPMLNVPNPNIPVVNPHPDHGNDQAGGVFRLNSNPVGSNLGIGLTVTEIGEQSLKDRMNSASDTTQEKPETSGQPNISKYGHQRAVSMIAVRNGKDFVYYQRMVVKMNLISKDYAKRKRYTQICMLEYGAILGIARLTTNYDYGECVEIFALKQIYKDVLADEQGWKQAIRNFAGDNDEKEEGSGSNVGVVVSIPPEMLRNLQAGAGAGPVAGANGNNDDGGHDGGHNPYNRPAENKHKDPFVPSQPVSRSTSKKTPKLKEFQFRPRQVTRVKDNLLMNLRTGRPIFDPRPTGAIPAFKFAK